MQATPPSPSKIKLLESCEVLDRKSEHSRVEFMYSIVVFTDGNTIFRAQTSYRQSQIVKHLHELGAVPIPRHLACPNVGIEQFITVTDPMPENCYVKTPTLLLRTAEDYDLVRSLVLSEARFYQALMNSPHPNVVTYYGCKLDGPLIAALCLQRYQETLYCRVAEKGTSALSVDNIVQGIRNGIEHIHSLGYCHNDRSPHNIMLRLDATPVIIDFDSCLPTNMKLGKAGNPDFEDVSVKFSKPERDFYGLRKIEEGLRRGDFCKHLM